MKRFVWRLQKILDLRTQQERLQRTELFRITEQLAARRGELLLRRRLLQDLLAEIARTPSAQRWSAQEFFLRHAGTDDEQIRCLQEQVAALEVRRREKAAEVLTVRRSKEGLAKLREQAREHYRQGQNRLEQKELDERATITFTRPAATPGDL